MATATYWQRGEAIDFTNGTGSKIDANEVVLLGSRLGIAGTDIPNGETGSLIVSGVFELPKDYGDSGKALSAGQEVQWDDANSCIKAAVAQVVGTGGDAGKVTTEASPVHGFAVQAALTTDRTVLVKINA